MPVVAGRRWGSGGSYGHTGGRAAAAWIGFVACVWCGLGPLGCALAPPATVPVGAPHPVVTEAVIDGDWDDADAAVRTAVRREQMAVESKRAYRTRGDGTETVRVYALRTVRGDSGELTLTLLEDGRIGLTCRVGVVGSATAERSLVDEVVARMRVLRGRDYAPLGGE